MNFQVTFKSSHTTIWSTLDLFPGILAMNRQEGVSGEIEAAVDALQLNTGGQSAVFAVRGLNQLTVSDRTKLTLDIRTDGANEGLLRIRTDNTIELVLLLSIMKSVGGATAAAADAAKQQYDMQSCDQPLQLLRLGGVMANEEETERETDHIDETTAYGEEPEEMTMVEYGTVTGPTEPKRSKMYVRRTIVESRGAPSMPNLVAATSAYEPAAPGSFLPPHPPSSAMGNHSWNHSEAAAGQSGHAAAAAAAAVAMQSMCTNMNAQASGSLFAPPPHPSQHQPQQQGFNCTPSQRLLLKMLQQQHQQQQQLPNQQAIGLLMAATTNSAPASNAWTAAAATPQMSAAAALQGLLNGGDQKTALPQQLQLMPPQGDMQPGGLNGQQQSSETARIFEELAARVYKLDAPKRAHVLDTIKNFLYLSGV